jgi:phosphoribosyl-AMP cyclohydrolase
LGEAKAAEKSDPKRGVRALDSSQTNRRRGVQKDNSSFRLYSELVIEVKDAVYAKGKTFPVETLTTDLQPCCGKSQVIAEDKASACEAPFPARAQVVETGFGMGSVITLRSFDGSEFAMAETTQSGPDFSKSDLIPVIAQDDASGDVLMLAYMNETAWRETLATGRVCYYSRSRQKLWRKGEESGNVQEVKSIFYDCDADTILIRVNQIGGAACHEGYKSCFFRKIDPHTGRVEVVGSRLFDPKAVYKK